MSPAARAEAHTQSIRLAVWFGISIFVVDLVVFALLERWAVGIVVGLAAAVGCAWLAYTRSTDLVLGSIGARAVEPAEQPRLASLVDGLSIVSGVHRPRLYLLDTPATNCVVVGHDLASSSLVVTSGLLAELNRVELEGVLAHAMSRLDTGEAQVTTVAAATVGLPILLADRWLRADGAIRIAGKVISPIARLVAPLVGRVLEHDLDVRADLSGVALTRFPPGLASALGKLSASDTSMPSSPVMLAPLHLLAPFESAAACPIPAVVAHLPAHRSVSERVELLREL